MARPDFLVDPDFRRRLRVIVDRASMIQRVRYDEAIFTALNRFLDTAGRRNFDTESSRPYYQQRDESAAVDALNRLVEDAASIAGREGRTRITEADFALAFTRRFCDFWPFC